MSDEPRWFGVKTVVEHTGLAADPDHHVYEERVVVLRAIGFDEALERAEVEVARYVSDIGAVYLGYCNAFAIDEGLNDEALTDGSEVYSSMREVRLPPDAFLARYHDAETEKAT